MLYRQVASDNMTMHTLTNINTTTCNAQDNDMFYYFFIDSCTPSFCSKLLVHASAYTVDGISAAATLLKQIIILTQIDNLAVAQHVQETLIESKQKLLALKGNITEFNTWVHTQLDCLYACDMQAVDLLHYLWKAYKAAPDENFMTYIKDMKSQAEDG